MTQDVDGGKVGSKMRYEGKLMSEQPGKGNGETPNEGEAPREGEAPKEGGTPEGYQPPSYIHDQYGQPPVTPYSQPAGQGQYGQPAYGQSPYGLPPVSPYGQAGYYGVPVEPKGLSIASLVCGLASVFLGFFILPQLGAIVLGHLALGREPSGKAMSITGLILGYLCLLGYGLFWIFVIVFAAQYAQFN